MLKPGFGGHDLGMASGVASHPSVVDVDLSLFHASRKVGGQKRNGNEKEDTISKSSFHFNQDSSSIEV